MKDAMSDPDTGDAPPTATPRRRRRRTLLGGWGKWLILGAILVYTIIYLPSYIRSETKLWRAAPLLTQYNAAFIASPPDLEAMKAAHSKLNEIAGEDCKNTALLTQRMKWRRELKDYKGALADLDKLTEIAESYGSAPPQLMRYERCSLLVLTGQPEKAVELCDKILNNAKENTSEFDFAGERIVVTPFDWNALNFAAYLRAVAEVELDTALEYINRTIKNTGPIPAFLDTRGFIHFKRKEYSKALANLEGAVEAYALMEDWDAFFKANRSEATSLDALKVQHRRAMREVSVIYYHRGLVYEAMGREAEAQKDFDHVRELGQQPTPSLF